MRCGQHCLREPINPSHTELPCVVSRPMFDLMRISPSGVDGTALRNRKIEAIGRSRTKRPQACDDAILLLAFG